MDIIIEKYQLAVDQFEDFSRFWVTLKDQQGKSKVLNVECSNTVQHVWKIDDREELFRALFPILKNKIKELMNKEIRTIDQLPVIRFSSYNVPKYAPNEALSLPHTFNLSGHQAEQALQEKKKNSIDKKVQPNWAKIAVIVGIIALVLMIVIPVCCHYIKKAEDVTAQFYIEQKIANGLYSELLFAQNRLGKSTKDIATTKIRAYLSSGEYLSTDIHTQISNFLTSIDNRNFKAAEEQMDDVISKIERKYGCHISDIQVGVDTNHPAISADNVTIPRR